MKIDNPLNPGVKQPIQTVLRLLAAQENCDGEPYDQLIQAADYIDLLEAGGTSRVGLYALYTADNGYIEIQSTDIPLIWLRLVKGLNQYYFKSDCGRNFTISEVKDMLQSSTLVELRVHDGVHSGTCVFTIDNITTLGRFV